MQPQTIDRYTITSLLHQGSAGPTYEAFDPQLQHPVALKLLPLDLLPLASYRERLQQATPLLKGFADSNIVPIDNIGKTDQWLFVATRLITGISLAERLMQGSLTLAESLAIYSRTASALLKAHDKGVVHYNLRPSQILLDEQRNAHLSGFALPILTEVHNRMQPQDWLRYMSYLSPEQITPGAEVGPAGDIYGLGVILYQMLTGELPFQGSTVRELADQHRRAPLPNVRTRNPIVPVEVDDIVNKSLAKNPADRFSSVEDILVLLLTSALPIENFANVPPAPPQAVPESPAVDLPSALEQPPPVLEQSAPPRSRARRIALLVGGLAVLCCALLVIGTAALQLFSPNLNTAEAQPLSRLATIPEHGYEMMLPAEWFFQKAGPLAALDDTVEVTAAAAQQSTINSFLNGIDYLEFGASAPVFSTMITTLDSVPDAIEQPRPLLLLFTNAIPISGVDFGRVHNTSVAGQAAAYADFTGVSLVDGLPYAGRIVAVTWSGKVGFFVGVASTEQWDAYSPTFNAIIDSITITDTPQ